MAERIFNRDGVTLDDFETQDFVVLVWRGGSGSKVENHVGVGIEHETRVDQGVCEFQIQGRRPNRVEEGESIMLPIGTPYTVEVIRGPALVRCFYPKGPAADEIQHLRARNDRTDQEVLSR